MRTVGRMALGAGLAVLAAGTVMASWSAEDDLAVVKRAVRHDATVRVAQAKPAEEPAAESAPTRHVANKDLKWFKVRVVEKGSNRAKVTVNLPIGLVRALDDFPIDIGGHGHDRDGEYRAGPKIKLGDVLATLEGGQSLVEIDDEDATVRVWVE
jgi:hypothetical protein